jgi:hypothetical protein
MYLATLGCVLARAGKRDAAVEVLRTLERRSSEQYVSPLDLCIAHAGFKDHRASLACLGKDLWGGQANSSAYLGPCDFADGFRAA